MPSAANTSVPDNSAPDSDLLIIRPSRGWSPVDLREIWQFRDLFRSLTERDLKLRYKQTVLGVLWVVLQPLTAAGIFAFVFGRVAKLEAPGGVPYFLFSFTGMLAWALFNGTLNRASGAMIGNEHLVSKVYFPRLILPLSTLGAALLDFLMSSAMLVVMLLAYWHLPGLRVLMVPVCVVIMLTLALGVGMITGALAVSFRDVGYIVPVALQFLLYLSPIAYPLAEVPEAYRAIYSLNPLVPLLEGFRWAVLGVGELRVAQLAYAAIVSIVIAIIGAFVFRRMERKFADVI